MYVYIIIAKDIDISSDFFGYLFYHFQIYNLLLCL